MVGRKRSRRAASRRPRSVPGSSGAGPGLIPGRVDIGLRPEEVDLIIGKGHHGAVLSGKTARELIRLLEPHKDLLRTTTADNGKDFPGYAEIAAALDLDLYRARPYHPWERGFSEHTNGLAREYSPKWKEFKHVPTEEVQRVQELRNNRPRKVLGYRTSAEVLQVE